MDADSPANAEREDTKAASFPAAVGVVLLIVLLVLVRAYRLDTQSVWWDDYNGLVGLRASDLRSSLELARNVNPDAAPLYYIVQYGFSRVLGASPVVIRALSILFGVLTLPVVYLLGRDIYGRTAGLVGALCFSLSPIHVYHDQSMRPYPLLALLAACSAYALLRALRTARAVVGSESPGELPCAMDARLRGLSSPCRRHAVGVAGPPQVEGCRDMDIGSWPPACPDGPLDIEQARGPDWRLPPFPGAHFPPSPLRLARR